MLKKESVRKVIGREAIIDGPIATSTFGGMTADASSPPAGAARLPENWRNLLGRASWFAKTFDGPNDARTCIQIERTHIRAGSVDAVLQLPCTIDDGGRFPMLLPQEIAWHLIPGQDGASVWEYERGYALQTDSGIRVYSTRDTSDIDPHPWYKLFDYFPSDYATYEIDRECLAEWISVFERPPSSILEFSPLRGEIHIREARDYTSPWSYATATLPAKLLGGEPPEGSVWLPAQCALYALKAVSDDSSVLISFKQADDPVYFTGDRDAAAMIDSTRPVRVRPPARSLIAPKAPESQRNMRATNKAGGG